MYATFGRNHGVQLIDDHVLYFADNGLETRRSDGDGEAFWRCDEDVGWVSQHFLSVGLRGVTGTKADSDFLSTIWKIMFSDFVQRANQVTLDVVGEGFDGRDVNGVYFLFQLFVEGQTHQLVDDREKRREGLTRTGRRTKEEVVLVHDSRNGEFLGACKIRKFISKPLTNGRA